MKKLEIYLAGGSKHEADEGMGWREQIEAEYGTAYDSEIKIINPLNYFRYSKNWHQSDKQVKQYFLSRIKQCDVVLVNLNNSDKSCGTCQEVQYAVDHEIPVIGFGYENVYNWLLVDCQCVFEEIEDAMEYIVTYYIN